MAHPAAVCSPRDHPGRHDGVCANVAFPFPGAVIGGALASAGGVDPDADPWAPERSVWPLLEVVDASIGEAWLSPLAAHLSHSAPEGEPRRFASARHIADLYDRYGVHRPEMVRAWLNGDLDEPGARAGNRSSGGGSGTSRAARAGRAAHRSLCPGSWLSRRCSSLRGCISLFGLTRLPASYLDVLDAIAAERDVHLFLLHPSPALWDRLAGADRPARGLRRADDPTADATANPLLASWGRDAREMQLVLQSASSRGTVDYHRPVEAASQDLLHQLQADIRADRELPGLPTPGSHDRRTLLDLADRSVQIHACHGRGRQVEVLRDTVLHLLENDPSLKPRDIIVMCPDIELFAPLIQATFGSFDPEDDSG